MEILNPSAIDYGVARFILPGQSDCGDEYLVSASGKTALIAVADGLGHGEDAAVAARVATSTLAKYPEGPIDAAIEACHRHLRKTRGVALSLSMIDVATGLMTWAGVGNVQGFLLRNNPGLQACQQVLLLRPGIVGVQLPLLQQDLLPLSKGDTLIFATDGLRNSFSESLLLAENPQKAADRILNQFRSGNDDALVLVARFLGNGL